MGFHLTHSAKESRHPTLSLLGLSRKRAVPGVFLEKRLFCEKGLSSLDSCRKRAGVSTSSRPWSLSAKAGLKGDCRLKGVVWAAKGRNGLFRFVDAVWCSGPEVLRGFFFSIDVPRKLQGVFNVHLLSSIALPFSTFTELIFTVALCSATFGVETQVYLLGFIAFFLRVYSGLKI